MARVQWRVACGQKRAPSTAWRVWVPGVAKVAWTWDWIPVTGRVRLSTWGGLDSCHVEEGMCGGIGCRPIPIVAHVVAAFRVLMHKGGLRADPGGVAVLGRRRGVRIVPAVRSEVDLIPPAGRGPPCRRIPADIAGVRSLTD